MRSTGCRSQHTIEAKALRFFVINLDRSTERWHEIAQSAADIGVDVTRVPGTDGAAIPVAEWRDVDHDRFRRSHGRIILPGEYGCYRSHLAALQAVIDSGEAVAVICEDDIVLKPETPAAVAAILEQKPDLHVLKLANHRIRGFVSHGGEGIGKFGRCVHGPQGSAACYAVTREGARILHDALQTMWLPWDIAFERGWALNARIYTVPRKVIGFSKLSRGSTITTSRSSDYKSSKIPLFQRTPTLLFRAVDYVRRAAYAWG